MVLTMNKSASVKRDLDFLSRSRPSTFVDAFLAAATDLTFESYMECSQSRSCQTENASFFYTKSQPAPRSSRSIANVLYVAVRLVRVGYLHSRTSHVSDSPSP
jgi:hypothetical protein